MLGAPSLVGAAALVAASPLFAAAFPLDALRDLWGPGLVFLLLAGWLVRKAWKAARTEGQLEEERRDSAGGVREADLPAPALPAPRLVPSVPGALEHADTSAARAEHLQAVAALLQEQPAPCDVVWVRSLGAHVAWLERGPGGEQSLQVALLDAGRAVQRWTFR